jgi:hypothetical protein
VPGATDSAGVLGASALAKDSDNCDPTKSHLWQQLQQSQAIRGSFRQNTSKNESARDLQCDAHGNSAKIH